MVQFGTSGIRGSVAERVTPAVALAVGHAVGDLAVTEPIGGDESAGSPPTVVVGRDGRPTGAALAAAVEAGVAAAGAIPIRVGRVATPTLAFASQGRYGVVLTASHNPPTDNGIKCFVDGSEFDTAREQRVESVIEGESTPLATWSAWQTPRESDPIDAYREAVVEYVRSLASIGGFDDAGESHVGVGDSDVDADADDAAAEPCEGVRVAVDCGNGMAGGTTPHVLEALGADVAALNANVDGRFPSRPSKPTAATLGDLRAFVADGEFDLGVAHDGDADRLVVLDADGDVVHEDTVTAILAGYYTRRAVAETDGSRTTDGGGDDSHTADVESDDSHTADGEDDSTTPLVLTTPNTSARIDEQVAAAGGRTERVALGTLHEGRAERRAAGERVVLATEPWKHIHPELGGWIDGVASAAVFARLVASAGLDSLREPITERPYRKVNIECPDGAKAAALARLESSLPAAFPEAMASLDYGVRLAFPDGSWLLVRPSGTEPYVRLYAESDDLETLLTSVSERIESAVATATDES